MLIAWCGDCGLWHDPTADCVERATCKGRDAMDSTECRELSLEELDGIVGGLAGEFRLTKLQRAAAVRSARAHVAPAVPSFRGAVAEVRRTPAAAASPAGGACAGGSCRV